MRFSFSSAPLSRTCPSWRLIKRTSVFLDRKNIFAVRIHTQAAAPKAKPHNFTLTKFSIATHRWMYRGRNRKAYYNLKGLIPITWLSCIGKKKFSHFYDSLEKLKKVARLNLKYKIHT